MVREQWPLIQFPDTQLHCRRLFTNVSGFVRGPQVLCRQLFAFSPFLFSVPSKGSHYPAQKVTNLFLSSNVWHIAILLVQSFLPDDSVASLFETHPRLCQPHLCCHLVWLCGSTMRAWTATISCVSILKTCLNALMTALSLSSQTRTHSSPHTFGDHFRQKKSNSMLHSFSWQPWLFLCNYFAHVLSFFFFESAMDDSCRFCFRSLDSVESFLSPRPIFTSKPEDTADVFHHPSALHSPRHISASVDLHIFPPSLVCGLHPVFGALVRLPFTIHGAAEEC